MIVDDPYPFLWQAWADSKQAGTRYGPVHLFQSVPLGGKLKPLCGRSVKFWNFEGHTETDFCPRCKRLADQL